MRETLELVKSACPFPGLNRREGGRDFGLLRGGLIGSGKRGRNYRKTCGKREIPPEENRSKEEYPFRNVTIH